MDTMTVSDAARRWRRPLLAVSVLRYLVPIAALPLAPALIPDDVGLLILLRPSKEVLLLGGGVSSTLGAPTVLVALLAYVPLMVGGVWAFFGVGRAYAGEIAAGGGPAWLQRMVAPEKLEAAQRVLARRGPTVAILGRLAALPPTVVAVAAGTSGVDARTFLLADLAGALAAFVLTFGAGMALGSAYEQAGPWVTAGGIVLLLVVAGLLARWLRAEL